MIVRIIEAISFVLNKEFGDECKNYTERREQDMNVPCFFIFCSTSKKKHFSDKKYFRSNVFCIEYTPSTENVRTECNKVAESLFECLEYIDVDGILLRGAEMEAEIKEGMLFFSLNYDFFVYKQDVSEKMEQVSSIVKVKGKVEDGSGKKESDK